MALVQGATPAARVNGPFPPAAARGRPFRAMSEACRSRERAGVSSTDENAVPTRLFRDAARARNTHPDNRKPSMSCRMGVSLSQVAPDHKAFKDLAVKPASP